LVDELLVGLLNVCCTLFKFSNVETKVLMGQKEGKKRKEK